MHRETLNLALRSRKESREAQRGGGGGAEEGRGGVIFPMGAVRSSLYDS